MSLPFAEQVEYMSASTRTDRYSGELVEDWSATVSELVAEVAVEPVHDGEQDNTYRQSSIVGYRLYHRLPVAVDRRWRVKVRGDELRITGRPAEWHSPYSGFAGVVVECQFQEG